MAMFPYADYEFYSTKAKGKLEREVFEAEALEASFFLRHLTLRKSDCIQPEVLSYATCAIADMYADEKKKAISGEGRIKSENNDGYSVSFVTELKDGESMEELLARKAGKIARQYLVGTELLSRKVRCRNDY